MANDDSVLAVRRALSDPFRLVERLGLAKGSSRHAGGVSVCCPAHRESNPSCSVTRGPDGTVRVRCFSCDWTADALGLVAQVHGLDPKSDFREVLATAAELAGMWEVVAEIRGTSEPRSEPRQVAQQAAQSEPQDREPERDYPDADDVRRLWLDARPVQTDEDAVAYLAGRGIDPASVDQQQIIRVLHSEQDLPAWAKYRGRTWLETGHRLIMRAYDASGKTRSVRAWRITDSDTPKRLPPGGHKAAGLVLANVAAWRVLTGKDRSSDLVIQEGEPDFAIRCTRYFGAVVGVGSGSWTTEFAERFAGCRRVVVRTDLDKAGHRYADEIAEAIKGKTELHRAEYPVPADGKVPDECDRAAKGEMPDDPFEDAKLWHPREDEGPRVLTVRQVLEAGRDAGLRAKSQLALTTGYGKLDEHTGGIRLGFSWLMMAETSWGKSSYVVALVDENMKRGHRALIVTAEDDEEIYGSRLLARRSGARSKALRNGTMSKEENAAIDREIQKSEEWPFFLNAIGKSVEWIARESIAIAKGENIKLVAYDYVQEMTSERPAKNDVTDLTNRARLLRHSAKSAKLASLILSQTTESPTKKYIDKESVRGSKDLSKGADAVLCGITVSGEPIEITREVNGIETVYQRIPVGARALKLDKIKNAPVPFYQEVKFDPVTASFVSEYEEKDTYRDSGFSDGFGD